MLNDIVQDQANGWFYRDLGDGGFANLSDKVDLKAGRYQIAGADQIARPVVLVRDGQPTGDGDALARRVAVVLHRRFVPIAA